MHNNVTRNSLPQSFHCWFYLCKWQNAVLVLANPHIKCTSQIAIMSENVPYRTEWIIPWNLPIAPCLCHIARGQCWPDTRLYPVFLSYHESSSHILWDHDSNNTLKCERILYSCRIYLDVILLNIYTNISPKEALEDVPQETLVSKVYSFIFS